MPNDPDPRRQCRAEPNTFRPVVDRRRCEGKSTAYAPNADACRACGLCVAACPERAITLARVGDRR